MTDAARGRPARGAYGGSAAGRPARIRRLASRLRHFRRPAIEDVLADAPRSGCRGKFTGEQVAQILATACEDPKLSGRPISDWTARELADEVAKRKYVDSISVSTIGRLLKSARLQPHRSEYWLNTKEKDRDRFDE